MAGSRPPSRLTPRQSQILSLAARGLSDKEIAARLQLSHRTIRTHFEKLFRDHGIRNRSQAISLWYTGSRERRPADECPYPKPFPVDFSDCPAYQATHSVTLDISHRPLGSVLTCRHLVSRLVPNTDFRWYGACVIGDVEARRRWSESVGSQRLREISHLREEVSARSAPYVQRIQELRSAETTGSLRKAAVAHEIDQLAAGLIADLRILLQDRQELLEQLHLPLEACLRLIRVAIDRFVQGGGQETEWEVPDEVLALFPPEIQSYFRPSVATHAQPSSVSAGPAV